ncbi:STAS domain-containing protein [Pseudoduganella sp. LjRoot289]|uniref:STAS domain-containing protein n=1 Tax=Pseudoduganella sp. LjRoot289 TaxID=3342314 RepID=UPI003ECF84F0
MGLFSLFKKGKPDAAAQDGDDEAARLAANSEAQRASAAAGSQLQRDIARATTLKIDAIEAAMEADIFNTPEPAWGSRAPRPPQAGKAPAPAGQPDHPDTLPLLEAHTTQLLADDEMPAPVAAEASAPVVEESAILYANGQGAIAEQMLSGALAEAAACGAGQRQDRTVWWLLFDLYQVEGMQQQFDSLSIDYASTFEVSPPAWRGPVAVAAGPAGAAGMAVPAASRPAAAEAAGATAAPGAWPASAAAAEPAAPAAYSGVTPMLAFPAELDAGAATLLEQLQRHAAGAPLRLDFSRVGEVDAAGCALLLAALQSLRKQGRELIVVAAAELAALLRAGIEVGHRGDGEARWLLLLELLQLLHREKEFEETSMDYCITFEVSPPPYAPPAPQQVATAARQSAPAAAAASDRFMLPPVIEGNCTALLDAVSAYAGQYPALVFDCSRLARLDYGAANQLLARLQMLASGGDGARRVEFREVNHLVAALLRLLGYAGLARIFAHKY